MGKFKGSGWLAALELIKQRIGSEGLEKLKARLSEEDRKLIFGKPILAISWLDYAAYIRMMIAADQMIGIGNLAFLAEAARTEAQQNLKGMYRFLLSITSTQTALAKIPIIWKQYFDTGTITVERSGKGFVDIQITDWPDIPLHHEIPQGAYMEAAAEISGGRNPRYTHPQCIARGDAVCLLKFVWEE